MIFLSYQNGSVLTFEKEVWSTLRKQYRIVGTLIGCLPKLPRQNIFHGLPMTLMPEQALLLVEKKIARIVEWSNLNIEPDQKCIEIFNKELKDQQKIQNESFKIKRKLEIEINLDKIIAAKQKKQLLCDDNIDRQKILEDELNKIPDVTETNLLTPLQIDAPAYMRGDPIDVDLTKIRENMNPVRYKVFTDLWEREFYVTDGLNFGGDFLVYHGDPSVYHASFIVKCVKERNYNFQIPEFVALGRLGNSVKKKFVLASEENSKIQYLTLTWCNDE